MATVFKHFSPNFTGALEGEMGDVDVTAPGFGPATGIIDPTQPFTITVSWTVTGALVTPANLPAGTDWEVSAFAEQYGPGPEVLLAAETQDVTVFAVVPNGRKYSKVLTISPGTLPERDPVLKRSGIYKLAVTVVLPNPTQPDLVGVQEGPIIEAKRP
ncbi:hypothetical protein [Cryptosporangium phraense]|uniref:Uncharacterized protein n=1 Tax=Cryptosporangium phraense TaxID=2593070 RepID=A0A545B0G8_9ACTN|nr:hypothetical protein [Cryptosporangium phraense]TQS47077.1 hypothetical protein FL583_02110 [Cryptosporangium phraense]